MYLSTFVWKMQSLFHFLCPSIFVCRMNKSFVHVGWLVSCTQWPSCSIVQEACLSIMLQWLVPHSSFWMLDQLTSCCFELEGLTQWIICLLDQRSYHHWVCTCLIRLPARSGPAKQKGGGHTLFQDFYAMYASLLISFFVIAWLTSRKVIPM